MQLCGLCGDTPSWCATSITRSPDCTASTAQYRSSTLDMTISANSGSLCRVTLTRGFWFADLESGDGFGGRAAGLGQQLVAVVDAEGMVSGLDGQGSSSVDDSVVNALPCNGYGAAAADPTFDLDGFGCWLGWWSGGSGVADAC